MECWPESNYSITGFPQIKRHKMGTVTPQTLPSVGTTQYSQYLWKWRSSATGYEIYDLEHTPGNWAAGATTSVYTIQVDTSTNTWSDHGSNNPVSITIGGVTHSAVEENSNGTVSLYGNSGGTDMLLYVFTKPTTASWISSGPTVTSITRNASTNLITVLHTGTLSSSDVTYTISNVSSSITNLQTITNGSTFTTSGTNGTHVIQIGNEILSYFIYNTTSGRNIMSSNNNLTVSFPTTDNDWLSNFSAYNSNTIANVVYTTTKTFINFAKNAANNYFVFITFNLSYNSTQGGFSVLTQIYDYENSSAANNWAYSYSSTLQWVYPEATFESTGSADTLITLPTNDIVTSFNWNFASVVAPGTTTSNGGGKPDRYPLIMTNLFNRNRSIYSIGMTHKDTWDLFL